jgi:hypothetical protein
LKAVREKKQITYKGNPIKITTDFSMKTLKARTAWGEVFWALNENNFNPRILYSEKLSFEIDGAITVFHDEQKLKQCMTTKPPLQKIFERILNTESESQQNNEKTGYWRRKGMKVKSNIDLAAHNQTLEQLRKLNGRNHHIPISTNT